jgi:hypothetical protein
MLEGQLEAVFVSESRYRAEASGEFDAACMTML